MSDLVDAERVLVDHRRARQVLPDRVPVGVVVVGIGEEPVEQVEPEDEGRNLESRDEVALAFARLPGQHRGGGRLFRESRARRREGESDSAGEENVPKPAAT